MFKTDLKLRAPNNTMQILGLLYCVDVTSDAYVSEGDAASIFSFEVSEVSIVHVYIQPSPRH
jgi:hypothetical protein